MFLYEDIQWENSNSLLVGFYAGDGVREFILPLSSGDFVNLDTTSNVSPEIAGFYVFRVDQSNIIEQGTYVHTL